MSTAPRPAPGAPAARGWMCGAPGGGGGSGRSPAWSPKSKPQTKECGRLKPTAALYPSRRARHPGLHAAARPPPPAPPRSGSLPRRVTSAQGRARPGSAAQRPGVSPTDASLPPSCPRAPAIFLPTGPERSGWPPAPLPPPPAPLWLHTPSGHSIQPYSACRSAGISSRRSTVVGWYRWRSAARNSSGGVQNAERRGSR